MRLLFVVVRHRDLLDELAFWRYVVGGLVGVALDDLLGTGEFRAKLGVMKHLEEGTLLLDDFAHFVAHVLAGHVNIGGLEFLALLAELGHLDAHFGQPRVLDACGVERDGGVALLFGAEHGLGLTYLVALLAAHLGGAQRWCLDFAHSDATGGELEATLGDFAETLRCWRHDTERKGDRLLGRGRLLGVGLGLSGGTGWCECKKHDGCGEQRDDAVVLHGCDAVEIGSAELVAQEGGGRGGESTVCLPGYPRRTKILRDTSAVSRTRWSV